MCLLSTRHAGTGSQVQQQPIPQRHARSRCDAECRRHAGSGRPAQPPRPAGGAGHAARSGSARCEPSRWGPGCVASHKVYGAALHIPLGSAAQGGIQLTVAAGTTAGAPDSIACHAENHAIRALPMAVCYMRRLWQRLHGEHIHRGSGHLERHQREREHARSGGVPAAGAAAEQFPGGVGAG